MSIIVLVLSLLIPISLSFGIWWGIKIGREMAPVMAKEAPIIAPKSGQKEVIGESVEPDDDKEYKREMING